MRGNRPSKKLWVKGVAFYFLYTLLLTFNLLQTKMETDKEYHNRRITEVRDRIITLSNYIKANSDLKCNEVGVGGSYKKRRNSRYNANKEYRLSQFKSELEGLERVLKMHKRKINCL